MLETAFQRLQECSCHTMPVLRNGSLVGLLTMENLGEYFMIQSALRKSTPSSGPPHGFAPRHLPRTT